MVQSQAPNVVVHDGAAMYLQQAEPAAHLFPGAPEQATSPEPIVPVGCGMPPPEPVVDPEVPDPPDPEVVDPPDEPPEEPPPPLLEPPAVPAPLPPAPPPPFGSSLLPHAKFVPTRDKVSQSTPVIEIPWRVLECSSFVVVVMDVDIPAQQELRNNDRPSSYGPWATDLATYFG
jgi:hypothetical protein